jgi:hypothetical protein
MARELEARPETDVALAIGQDQAEQLDDEKWRDVDVAVVDVLDNDAVEEVGTDFFSGVSALERLRDLGVRTIAIAPNTQSPLLALRLFEARPIDVYRKHEIRSTDDLVAALTRPEPLHPPLRPSDYDLARHGAQRARANEAVHVYERSSLFGRLHAGLKLGIADVSRRQVDALRRQIARTGFRGTEQTGPSPRRAPRWPDTRRYLLKLLGRLPDDT